jgi:hypothetical protein
LYVALAVDVSVGTSSTVPVEMDVAAVTSKFDVIASDTAQGEESAQHNTINQSVVEKAPNQDESIGSLLPLAPGVVRGPDGRSNMKGAQATQAGWLITSPYKTLSRPGL